MVGLAGVARAQDTPVIMDAGVNAENHARIHVLLQEPAPKAGSLPDKSGWLVYEKTQEKKGEPPVLHKLDVESVDTSELSASDLLYLNLKEPVSDKVTWMELTVSGSNYLLHQAVSFPAKSGEKPAPFAASSSRGDSDVYFNGSLAAASGQSPIYNIDAFAGFMEGMQKGKKYYGELGMYGQVRTIQSDAVNPNSLEVYGVYQRLLTHSAHWYGPFQVPYLSYRFAGWEFDTGGKDVNFVTSPVVTVPFRLSGKQGVLKSGFSAPHVVLHLGAEFVDPEKSALAAKGGWHARGLLGAGFSTAYKPDEGKKFFDSATLNAAYQVRLLSAAEVYYDPKFARVDPSTGNVVVPPLSGSQARHYVDTTLCYNFAKWVGVSFEYTYGSLPPAFNLTPSTYNVGLTFTLKQASSGRYAILRP